MERDIRFDIARALSMCYIIAVLHLSQYLGQEYYIYETFIGRLVTFSCLGLFTFMSGYLIGKKYDFTLSNGNKQIKNILSFYKKRFIRIYPLFIVATILLYVIGFNGLKPSVYGMVGIAPFVTDAPKTLWYVSMLIIFYLLTPVINRNSIKWKTMISSILIVVFCLMKLFFYVDIRFIFNLFFYCFGLIISTTRWCYISQDEHSSIKLHVAIFLAYIVLLLLANYYLPNSIVLLSVASLGVLSLFSFSCLLAKIKSQYFVKVIGFVSYASMACYMFHRFYYWCGLAVFAPETIAIKTIYLVFVFVVGLAISYFVQKGYDNIVRYVK